MKKILISFILVTVVAMLFQTFAVSVSAQGLSTATPTLTLTATPTLVGMVALNRVVSVRFSRINSSAGKTQKSIVVVQPTNTLESVNVVVVEATPTFDMSPFNQKGNSTPNRITIPTGVPVQNGASTATPVPTIRVNTSSTKQPFVFPATYTPEGN